jgi:hypothetical protein
LHLHLRVDLPDGRYTLVPKGGDEGADEELEHVFVAQDLDQSPESSKTWIINPIFKILQLSLLWLCIYVLGVELKP